MQEKLYIENGVLDISYLVDSSHIYLKHVSSTAFSFGIGRLYSIIGILHDVYPWVTQKISEKDKKYIFPKISECLTSLVET